MKQYSGPVTCAQQTQFRQGRHQGIARRAGTMMHYYLVYLSLTSVLMMTAGVCLHAVLKADRIDSRNAHFLNTLLRLSRDMRLDSDTATSFTAVDGMITAKFRDGDVVTWSVSDRTVSRSGKADDKQTSTKKYVFHRGTEISFRVDPEPAILTVHLIEPSPHAIQPAAEKLDTGETISSAATPANDQVLSRTVEIQLPLSDPGSDS